jgi:hypothetical protein
MKMAEVANPIIVIITGEWKKLLLNARHPFLFFPGPKSESSITDQFVCLAEDNAPRALLIDREVQCKDCCQVAKFGRQRGRGGGGWGCW